MRRLLKSILRTAFRIDRWVYRIRYEEPFQSDSQEGYMTISEAIAINKLLGSLTNEDTVSWEEMEEAGRMLADHAHKVLMAGHNAKSFSAALDRRQGFKKRRPAKARGETDAKT
jgi:hypothetical protein